MSNITSHVLVLLELLFGSLWFFKSIEECNLAKVWLLPYFPEQVVCGLHEEVVGRLQADVGHPQVLGRRPPFRPSAPREVHHRRELARNQLEDKRLSQNVVDDSVNRL